MCADTRGRQWRWYHSGDSACQSYWQVGANLGAIASSKNTQDAGVSTGKRVKELAEQKALSKCASGGARDCKVDLAYFNQCASWVVPSGRSGGGQSGVGGGPTPERALFAAQLMCKNDQLGKCVEFYASCTKPIFEEF